MIDTEQPSALSQLDMVKDVMTVKRVFGEPYEKDGAVVIPVASVRGGGGGGAGEGTGPSDQGKGAGTGLGFGVVSRPVGVYVLRNGAVEWHPAFDVTRIALAGQLVALAAILAARSVLLHRRRRRG